MKTKLLSALSIMLFIVLFSSCNDNSGELETLTQENSDLSMNYEQMLLEARLATEMADSLQTVVHSLENEIGQLKGIERAYEATTSKEKAVEVLVSDLHNGWDNMLKSKDTNELLKFFLPEYTTSTIRIDPENRKTVERKNNTNFEAYLTEELLANDDLSISFGQTRFLYTEVRDNIFVTSYQTRIRVYRGNEEVHTSSIITLLAGEDQDGWKVGKYSWITFNYK